MKSGTLLKKDFQILVDDQKRAWNHRTSRRRLIDRVLSESYEKWQSLAENAPDLIITVDRDGKIQFINQKISIDALSLGEGSSVFDHFLPEYQDPLKKVFKKVFKTGEPESLETACYGPKGTIIWTSCRIGAIKHRGEVTSLILISRDVTEQKTLEKEIIEISSREQYRLGHDLHDSLGQHLTGVTFLCTVLAKKLTDKSFEEAADASRVAELISQATVKIRHIIRGLYPVQLESDGLLAALEELATQTEELFNVSCRFEYNKTISIHDSAYATHLYRIAQEAVNNAIKHGKARQIVIEILALPNRNILIIADDGKGITEDQKVNKGMGLHIMDYRARMIGGMLNVRRRGGKGTVVTCSFKV